MSSYVLLLTPIAFFMITGFILQQAFAVDPVGDIIDNILCPFPDYNNGIDNLIVGYTCSIIHHPTPYPDENAFGWPAGWFQWVADVIFSILYRISQGFLMLGAPFLILLPVLSILQAGGTDVFALVAPIYMFMYAMLAVGLYKTISPFVGN